MSDPFILYKKLLTQLLINGNLFNVGKRSYQVNFKDMLRFQILVSLEIICLRINVMYRNFFMELIIQAPKNT